MSKEEGGRRKPTRAHRGLPAPSLSLPTTTPMSALGSHSGSPRGPKLAHLLPKYQPSITFSAPHSLGAVLASDQTQKSI